MPASTSHSLICMGCTQSEWMLTTPHCNHPWIVNYCTNATNCTLSVASMLAPFPNNNCAISPWPLHAAWSNGVLPYCPCTKLVKYTTCNKISQKNIALLLTIQFPIRCTSHTLLAERHVSWFTRSSSNTINFVLCVYHTNLKFQPCNNSHIYHLHMP